MPDTPIIVKWVTNRPTTEYAVRHATLAEALHDFREGIRGGYAVEVWT